MKNEELVKQLPKKVLENLRKEKYTHLLEKIFRAQILQVCSS